MDNPSHMAEGMPVVDFIISTRVGSSSNSNYPNDLRMREYDVYEE